MPRIQRLLLDNECYHTVSTTRDRKRLFDDPHLAQIVVDCLLGQEKAFVLAYAVMPDHLHAIVVPKAPFKLPHVMQSIKGYSSRKINEQLAARGSIWQRSYFDRVIRSEEHFRQAVDYVHFNPVTAGLATLPEDYLFSSAHPGGHTAIEAWLGATPPRLESLGYG